MCQMNPLDFLSWLEDELTTRKWRPTDLAKQSKLSDAAVSRILRGERNADANTLLKFAQALNISPITIFRKAGLLPDVGGEEISFDDWKHLLAQLNDDDREELREIAERKIERRKNADSLKTLKPHKAR